MYNCTQQFASIGWHSKQRSRKLYSPGSGGDRSVGRVSDRRISNSRFDSRTGNALLCPWGENDAYFLFLVALPDETLANRTRKSLHCVDDIISITPLRMRLKYQQSQKESNPRSYDSDVSTSNASSFENIIIFSSSMSRV